MSNTLQVCIFNTDAQSSNELRTSIGALNFVRVVAEVSDTSHLAEALHNAGINLVFFNLDPDQSAVTDVIEHVSTRHPEVAMIAISRETDVRAVLGPMRAGCDQFVCRPIDQADLANAVARVASRRLARNTRSRCVCVVAPSGGAGATTIACNLALEIGHLSDRECGILDLDLQFGDIALNFDAEPKYTVYDLASSHELPDRSMLASTITTLPCKVALLARPHLVEQEGVITADLVHHIVALMTATYENLVVDTPAEINARTMATLSQADHILIVTQLLVTNVRNAQRYHDALVRLGIPYERLHFVVNRTDTRSSRVTLEDIEDATKKPPFGTVPNDYQFVAKSLDYGRPIAAIDANNPVRAAIRKIAAKILQSDAAGTTTDTSAEGKRGFLSRLLTKS